MTTKEKAIRWFEDIAYECDRLTSGNVAHLRSQIKGMAIRSAEYLTKHSQEPASEDLEQASEEYAYTNWESDDYHEGASEGKPFDAIGHTQKCFIDGARWKREQMMKDAVDGWVARDECGDIAIFSDEPHRDLGLGMWTPARHAFLFPRKDEYPDVTWNSEPQKVKVIIIKE